MAFWFAVGQLKVHVKLLFEVFPYIALKALPSREWRVWEGEVLMWFWGVVFSV